MQRNQQLQNFGPSQHITEIAQCLQAEFDAAAGAQIGNKKRENKMGDEQTCPIEDLSCFAG